MKDPFEPMTIGALAQAAGVNVETIRFYQRRGLLRAPERTEGRIRRYGAPALGRLRFIKAAQRLGFSLDEVAELLRLEDGTHCAEASLLAAQKLRDVRERLADLQRMESVLSRLLHACQSSAGTVCCPLIEALQEGAVDGQPSHELREVDVRPSPPPHPENNPAP
ncbi:Hg(II)-responsive transcriptional regulator [Tibeticola sp.]|jgi:MerR family mercuric resistance operon transcriptional regulator|uniref:Hg(II)-responsive transcriptional regulator n=1 Tax=Tibeticola sp. TaxID=2005368 RepID=UPI00258C01BD|nr:Hg(II)-responsive transcriptional regulator [Tibeticola sp.]MCI4440560.1 Hg(II)-responsive transcriptional regulator [Tibeticola sp.]